MRVALYLSLFLLAFGFIAQSDMIFLSGMALFASTALIAARRSGFQFSLFELCGSLVVAAFIATVMINRESDIATFQYKLACVIFALTLSAAGVVCAWLLRRNNPQLTYSPYLVLSCWCYPFSVAGLAATALYAIFWLRGGHLNGVESEVIFFAALIPLAIPAHLLSRAIKLPQQKNEPLPPPLE